ncbi:ABC transporter ATP-binding protein [Brachybacterium sp. YJGR34]|uniref:ABC transporter ATP-binding protein n=1 Tax=Brachybacterium sp. YJGR34 TaxID=2059911 RepID=UPI000E0B2DE1|nr:ABC transporter ATP-binding protein [Brachybacterium sp. YJGR34]
MISDLPTPGPAPDTSGAALALDERPLLRIRGLETHFEASDHTVKAVDGVDLTVHPGKTLCVVGESGCGKSATARSVLQLVESPGRVVGGEILWSPEGRETVDLATLADESEELRAVRGGEIGMVFQEPMASLSPLYTVGAQLTEAIRLHQDLTPQQARAKALTLLQRVGIPDPEGRLDAYPFQLSGGMCQRVMIAIALCCDPSLLIADEPTTALDVTTQARILDLLRDLQAENGMALMFITHDLGVVAEIADEVAVMYLGTVVERGPVEEIFRHPKHPYTRALLRSIPDAQGGRRGEPLPTVRGMVPSPQNRPSGCAFRTRCDLAMQGICEVEAPPLTPFGDQHEATCHLYSHEGAVPPPEEGGVDAADQGERAVRITPRPEPGQDAGAEAAPTILEVSGLAKHYPVGGGMFRRATRSVKAVDGVDLSIRLGETMGLVGESGCGKTTLGRCVAGLLAPSAGEILYHRADGEVVDLARLTTRQLKAYRTEIRTIFQDPFSSLNPRMTVEQIVGEPLQVNGRARGGELREQVAEMLRRVGIRPEHMRRYPHAFSGGERQRLNIARALITRPRLVIADEPVSALDVSIRAQILNLLEEAREEFDLTYLFISHDLSVVEHVSDHVGVMYLGRLAEQGPTDELYRAPQHPYTEALLDAVPVPDPERRGGHRSTLRSDDLPDPSNPPSGCLFRTRCIHVRDGLCDGEVPPLRELSPGHSAACHRSEEIELAGISRGHD